MILVGLEHQVSRPSSNSCLLVHMEPVVAALAKPTKNNGPSVPPERLANINNMDSRCDIDVRIPPVGTIAIEGDSITGQ